MQDTFLSPRKRAMNGTCRLGHRQQTNRVRVLRRLLQTRPHFSGHAVSPRCCWGCWLYLLRGAFEKFVD